MAIPLGVKARDIPSGWEGTVVARYTYLNGCVRYAIAGADKDGKPDEFVFDAQQIEVLDPPDPRLVGAVQREADAPEPTRSVGGPRDNRPVPR